MDFKSGRHFLQIPGPTNVPDRVLRAMARLPSITVAGILPACREVLEGLKQVFKTTGSVVIYPSSGTGAWEAALVNTLSPGDRVLMFETGQFCDPVAQFGRAPGPGGRFRSRRLDGMGSTRPWSRPSWPKDRGRAFKAVAIVA